MKKISLAGVWSGNYADNTLTCSATEGSFTWDESERQRDIAKERVRCNFNCTLIEEGNKPYEKIDFRVHFRLMSADPQGSVSLMGN